MTLPHLFVSTKEICTCGRNMYKIYLDCKTYDVLCLHCDLKEIERYRYDHPCDGCLEVEYDDEGGHCLRPGNTICPWDLIPGIWG